MFRFRGVRWREARRGKEWSVCMVGGMRREEWVRVEQKG